MSPWEFTFSSKTFGLNGSQCPSCQSVSQKKTTYCSCFLFYFYFSKVNFGGKLQNPKNCSLSQWLNFKLFGITYLLGSRENKVQTVFFRVHWLSEIEFNKKRNRFAFFNFTHHFPTVFRSFHLVWVSSWCKGRTLLIPTLPLVDMPSPWWYTSSLNGLIALRFSSCPRSSDSKCVTKKMLQGSSFGNCKREGQLQVLWHEWSNFCPASKKNSQKITLVTCPVVVFSSKVPTNVATTSFAIDQRSGHRQATFLPSFIEVQVQRFFCQTAELERVGKL